MIRWHGVQFRRAVKHVVNRKIRAAGDQYVNRLRANIGQPAPQPSSPGEYPRRDTGDLVESIFSTMDLRSIRYRAGTDVDYSQHIEALRPHLARTLVDDQASIVRAFKHG